MTEYSVNSCNVIKVTCGRQATGVIIESIQTHKVYEFTAFLECERIPNQRDDIPTKEVASYYQDLNEIEKDIPHLDPQANIQILTLFIIRQRSPKVHQVLDQKIGPKDTPHAQKLTLG